LKENLFIYQNIYVMNSRQIIAALMLWAIFSLSGVITTSVQAQDSAMHAGHTMVMPNDIKWTDAPPALPSGAKVAVIEGDPARAGLFTMRIKLPANYKILPHWHPADEHVTVLEGSFYMGLGEKFDEAAAKEIPTAGFAIMNMGTRHYAFAKNECTIQLHGIGPWGITYVNPADDPRNKR
jgi:quercetin dioxygenase-like cupin family protein